MRDAEPSRQADDDVLRVVGELLVVTRQLGPNVTRITMDGRCTFVSLLHDRWGPMNDIRMWSLERPAIGQEHLPAPDMPPPCPLTPV